MVVTLGVVHILYSTTLREDVCVQCNFLENLTLKKCNSMLETDGTAAV